MRIWILAALAILPAAGAEREFHEIVRAISDHYGKRPMHVPLMGLVNTFAFVARPGGASHIRIAVFEGVTGPPLSRETIDGIVGHGWKPFVQVTSRKRGQQEATFIHMRPDGDSMRLLVTAMEHREATVVELRVDANAFRKWVENPRHRFAD